MTAGSVVYGALDNLRNAHLLLGMARTGPKETERLKMALGLLKQKGMTVTDAAYLARVNPSTIYRALKRRKERK